MVTAASALSNPVLIAPVTDFVQKEHRLLIDGEWVPAVSGETFEVYDPSTGEVLARVAAGGAEDIDRAVRAARRAFDDGPWRTMKPSERGRIMQRLAQLME